ncbi:uncharacterized protein HOXD4 isoform X2 [Equus caballus]
MDYSSRPADRRLQLGRLRVRDHETPPLALALAQGSWMPASSACRGVCSSSGQDGEASRAQGPGRLSWLLGCSVTSAPVQGWGTRCCKLPPSPSGHLNRL